MIEWWLLLFGGPILALPMLALVKFITGFEYINTSILCFDQDHGIT
jgi:hypothetical protein